MKGRVNRIVSRLIWTISLPTHSASAFVLESSKSQVESPLMLWVCVTPRRIAMPMLRCGAHLNQERDRLLFLESVGSGIGRNAPLERFPPGTLQVGTMQCHLNESKPPSLRRTFHANHFAQHDVSYSPFMF